MKKVQLTQHGLENLQKEYDELIKKRRPKAVNRLQTARSMGDLSENSEYSAAKEELAFVEGRIQEIEALLKNIEIIQNKTNGLVVMLGSEVVVDIDGKRDKLQIVGEFEADPLNKKLSSKSPIGKALLNKKVGEIIVVIVPDGKKKYKILRIF
ncbi:transcription elongation factor GreA [Candidatus Roizmanbacteria bacterium]|nr:transcription elongation factor GreA [Candidatus Roizmanbacteria bacterium]